MSKKTSWIAAALWLSLTLVLHGQTVQAQSKDAAQLTGTTLEGAAFDLAELRGKVVLVVFWATDCAVCRDKMPELRANYQGWLNQPFEMVLVNTDRRLSDVQTYEKILELTVPRKQRFPHLWAGDKGYADAFGPRKTLPATYIVGKDGIIKKTYTGRVPPEAWDEIADLL